MPVVLPLPPSAQRANTPVWLARAAQGVLRLAGWRMVGAWPDVKKMVVIGAPHSSMWDGVVGLLTKVALDVHVVFMGKKEVFFWPIGRLLVWLGGMPVNRQAPGGIVDQVVQQFQDAEQMWLVLAPEGTRKAVTHWKPGFWKIAKGAGVPVCYLYFDYPSKTIGVGPLVALSDDMEADLQKIRAWYQPYRGLHRGV